MVVGVAVWVSMGVVIDVAVGVGVTVSVLVGIRVAVGVGVTVGVLVGVGVAVGVGVTVGALVGVGVAVGVGVLVGAIVGVSERGCGAMVSVGVGRSGWTGAVFSHPARAAVSAKTVRTSTTVLHNFPNGLNPDR